MAASTTRKFFSCSPGLQVQHFADEDAPALPTKRPARLEEQLAMPVSARVDAGEQGLDQGASAAGGRSSV